MSLISFATPWTNDDETTKKTSINSTSNSNSNIPRKTVKMRLSQDELKGVIRGTSEYESESSKYKQLQPSTIADTDSANNDKNNRVNELLERMNSASASSIASFNGDSESKMGVFNPPTHPIVQVKKEQPSENEFIPPPAPVQPIMGIGGGAGGEGAKGRPFSSYSNYHTSYDAASNIPSFKQGLPTQPGQMYDSRLMEKINYMIHMLENMENEKTANVTEEFILYTFLGIFVIFVVDSFSRGGKYVR